MMADLILLIKDKNKNMSILQKLLKSAMSEILGNPKLNKFPFNVFENGKVVLYQSVKGDGAELRANKIASHYWKCIQNRLHDKNTYYEVACTWIDVDGNQQSSIVNSLEFGHQSGAVPHWKTFNPPKGTFRNA